MIIKGTHQIEGVSAEAVFDALADPAVLARTLPGCRSLTERGEGSYDVAIDVGVGSVRGSYSGLVTIREARRPDFYEATLEAAGPPGSVNAALKAEFTDGEAGTGVSYEMDAKIAGRIAGVGQRVIAGVSRKNASAFFTALERELIAPPEPAPVTSPPAPAGPDGSVEGPAAAGRPSIPGAPKVYIGKPRTGAQVDRFVAGVALGFALSLILTLLGRRSRA